MKRPSLPRAYWLVAVATLWRLTVVQLFHVPRYVTVGLELALLITFFFRNVKTIRSFNIRWDRISTDLLIGCVFGIGGALLEIYWDMSNGETPEVYLKSFVYFPIAVLIAGWASSLYEELLFRSAIAGIMSKFVSPYSVIILQAFLFFIAHKRYFSPGHWHVAAIVGLNGLIWGYLTLKRTSILPSWVAHTIINTYGIIFLDPSEILSRVLSSWL